MLKKMNVLMKYKNHTGNKTIIGDWRYRFFPKNFFCVVLADVSLPYLPFKDYQLMFSKIYDWLLPSGIFLTRTIVYDKKLKNCNFLDLLKLFQNKKYRSLIFTFFSTSWYLKTRPGTKKHMFLMVRKYIRV